MVAVLRNDRGVIYPIGIGTTIGRDPANDLVLQEGSLSREHARIECRAGRWFIEDRGSRNGTSVNGERLPFARSRPLRHGDRIVLGTLLFTFSIDDEPVDPERTKTIQLEGLGSHGELSAYQRDVLTLLCAPWLDGGEPSSNAEIAARLGTPQATEAVKAALRRIYAKIGVNDVPLRTKRRALCEAARNRGLV